MIFEIQVEGIPINVTRKKIKNMYLRVQPPDGRVQISAPMRTSRGRILAFAHAKAPWIRKQMQKIANSPYLPPKKYVNGELFPLWGKELELQIIANSGKAQIRQNGRQLFMHVRPEASRNRKHDQLESWYRQQVREMAQPLIGIWEIRMDVKVNRFFVRRMKTLWGSCNVKKGTIRLNTELARRPMESLEYIVVHELAHLIEPSHNKVFYALMDRTLPDWKMYRKELKRSILPG